MISVGLIKKVTGLPSYARQILTQKNVLKKHDNFYYPFSVQVNGRYFLGLAVPSVKKNGSIWASLCAMEGGSMSAPETEFHYRICEDSIRREIALTLKSDIELMVVDRKDVFSDK